MTAMTVAGLAHLEKLLTAKREVVAWISWRGPLLSVLK